MAAMARDRRRWGVCALGAALALTGLHGAADASAGAPVLGTAEPLYLNAGKKKRKHLFEETVKAGGEIVRFNAFWFRHAPTEPAEPRDPADPAYDFDRLDKAVREASARGLEIFITLQRAPEWAESRPNREDRGAWKPDPDAFADYAFAVASRYSGLHPDPKRSGSFLPRVGMYQAWNETNLEKFFAPQYTKRGELRSPEAYRVLLNKAYDEIKSVHLDNQVIIAGSAPTGPNAPTRIAPVNFWRAFFCIRKSLEPRKKCGEPARFDVFDHHPIAVKQRPEVPGRAGNVLIADYHRVAELLRAAERHGTIAGPPRHEMWASEVYWETNPPDDRRGFPPKKAARFLAHAIYLLDRQKVDVVLNFFMIDAPLGRPGDVANVQGGLLWADGSRKPTFKAFRFPLVGDAVGRRNRVRVWGIAPRAGTVLIKKRKRRSGRWHAVRRIEVGGREEFQTRFRLGPRGKIRAGILGQGVRSRIWRMDG